VHPVNAQWGPLCDQENEVGEKKKKGGGEGKGPERRGGKEDRFLS
jgi:hypothetical protein